MLTLSKPNHIHRDPNMHWTVLCMHMITSLKWTRCYLDIAVGDFQCGDNDSLGPSKV